MYIFISTRAGDNQNIGDRMADHLRLRYGEHNILRELTPNADEIRRSQVILAVIGPQWLTAASPTGDRLLDNPTDPVHTALALALREGKLVVPLLIDGATMPSAQMLPPDLAVLAEKQAVVVRGDPFFHEDMLRAFAQINTQLAWRPASWGTLIGMLAVLISFFAIVVLDIVNNGTLPTTGPLNGLLILLFLTSFAAFLVTVGWAIRFTAKRQGWLWMAAVLTSLVLVFGIPIAVTVAKIPTTIANGGILFSGGFMLVALFGVALFGPRKETTRAIL